MAASSHEGLSGVADTVVGGVSTAASAAADTAGDVAESVATSIGDATSLVADKTTAGVDQTREFVANSGTSRRVLIASAAVLLGGVIVVAVVTRRKRAHRADSATA